MKDDTISRAAAIDALADYIHNVDRVYSTGKLTHEDCMDAAHSVLDALPSAQRWIPCKERLPKESQNVLTIDRYGDYEINHIIDGDEWYWEPSPVVWCPLPEPYKEHADAD